MVFRILIVASLALHAYAWLTLLHMVNLGLPSFNHYRLTALERRDGAAVVDPTRGPGVLRFGLIDGAQTTALCGGVREPTFNMTSDGAMLLSFELAGAMRKRSQPWDGWYIITALEEGSQAQDPVSWHPLAHFLSSIHPPPPLLFPPTSLGGKSR